MESLGACDPAAFAVFKEPDESEPMSRILGWAKKRA
jgi:hypothetical protein